MTSKFNMFFDNLRGVRSLRPIIQGLGISQRITPGGVSMANTLGSMIGIVEHSFSVKNDADEVVQLNCKIDFTTSTDAEIKAWLAGNRTIAFQRPARALSAAELKKLNGSVIMAKTAGAKIQSETTKIRAAINVLKELGQVDAAKDLEAKLEEKLAKEAAGN